MYTTDTAMSNSNLVHSTSTDMQSAHSQLLELPNEILQEIACCLPSDRDVLHLSQSCKEMWVTVFEYESAIWRARFVKHYDMAPGRPSRELRFEYQIRAIVLSAPIQFKEEEDDRQYLWMEVMQTMLEESLKIPIALGEISKTLQRIRETLRVVNFLSKFQKERTCSQLFYALQLCLTSFALDPTIAEPCRRTDYDIRQVYSYEERVGGAFIDHDDLDLPKLLNLRNFWQRHFLNASELTYQESFSGLPEELKPKTRKDNPAEVSKLSPSWLGYYSCMHPLSDLQRLDERQTCADLETHGDSIDVMVGGWRVARKAVMTRLTYVKTLDLQPSPEKFWPEQCSKLIPLASGPEIKQIYFDGRQRAYGGAYEAGNYVFGFTEEIAVPHGGFEGWTRVCFIIVETDDKEDEMPPSPAMDGEGWIYGYEAVIIPGGRIMLGRWVDMKEPEARGPFIFWDV